jgi:hypothetical protein
MNHISPEKFDVDSTQQLAQNILYNDLSFHFGNNPFL